MNNLIDAFITRSHLPSSVTAIVQVATLPFLIYDEAEDDVGSDGREEGLFLQSPSLSSLFDRGCRTWPWQPASNVDRGCGMVGPWRGIGCWLLVGWTPLALI